MVPAMNKDDNVFRRPVDDAGCMIYRLFPCAYHWSGAVLMVGYHRLSSFHATLLPGDRDRGGNDGEGIFRTDPVSWCREPIAPRTRVEAKGGHVLFSGTDGSHANLVFLPSGKCPEAKREESLWLAPQTLFLYAPGDGICAKIPMRIEKSVREMAPEEWFTHPQRFTAPW